MAAADSSSSSSISTTKYDVFLSFRGPDTRRSFVAHLYRALQRIGLTAFIDDEKLQKGEFLWVLLNAIESSKLSVVVLSKNYAFSKWCLIEVAKIVECMDRKKQIVVPIFYDVDIADVRYQRESFADAFAKHVEDRRESSEDLERWKSALRIVAGISGWDSRKYEVDTKLIDEIVKDILEKVKKTWINEPSDLVGMDYHIKQMKYLLDLKRDDVRVVGIWGMGGIGKTTIARVVFDRFASEFENFCFLESIKDNFKRKSQVEIQEELLFRILKEEVQSLGNLNNGSEIIREMLNKRKIFLVLDDVDSYAQVEALLGRKHSFGRGSRIIITTRDQHLLCDYKEYQYNPQLIKDDELALELFRNYAKPSAQCDPLSSCAIKYAQGLPLALKVLGSSLRKKSKDEWEDEFKKIKKFQDKGIGAVLRTSFERLDDPQKKIFLDTACFFRGMKKNYAINILDACGLFPKSGFRVLVDRALVTTTGHGDDEMLAMHDLLRDMAFEIVRQELKPSRLTIFDEIEDVLTDNSETEAVESLDLDLYNSEEVDIYYEAFVSMKKLRLLRIHYNRSIHYGPDYYCAREELYQLSGKCKQHLSKELKFLSHELRCLIWHGFPLKSLPSNFRPKHLVDLDMRGSHMEQLWEGTKPLQKLKYINLSQSPYLRLTPDLTKARNLEILNLEGCTSLLMVHSSISDLENLVFLNLKECKELKFLPRSICMKSLKSLELSGCSVLENFPEISEVIEGLPRLCLNKTAIRELPVSIIKLSGLVTLSLKDCRELKTLPRSICQLKSLRYVNLSGCSKFEAFPKIAGKEDMEKLLVLHLDGTSIKEFLPPISALENLDLLSLRECKELKSLPSSIDMPSLKSLILSGCSNLEKFPEILGTKSLVSKLDLDDIAIEELPPSIKNLQLLESLSLRDCGEIKSLPSSIFQLSRLKKITLSGCSKFEVFPEIAKGRLYSRLFVLRIEDCKEFRSLPSSICLLRSLRFITLSGCLKFEVFPEILEDMVELRELHLDGTSIEKLPQSIKRLKKLMLLNMSNCRSLLSLPNNICNLSYLRGLTLLGCSNLHNLPDNFGNLKSLLDLEIEGSGIRKLPSLSSSSSSSTDFLVGMDRRIKEMQLLLCNKVDDVCIVGICGTGGIGKTTIARAVYDKIAPQFEHHCFFKNVEEGFRKHGAVKMQGELLSRIMKVQSVGFSNACFNMMKESLQKKKVLLILDDVGNIAQMEALLGKQQHFGGGSRIIVTTRDEQILSGCQIYRPGILEDIEAMELFKHHAFGSIKPCGKYEDLSLKIIKKASGCPLVLKIFGSLLFNRDIDVWKTKLKGFDCESDLFKMSFEYLHESEKDIFLDVACFFNGMEIDYVTEQLQSCGFFPYSGLRVLMDRSLIDISHEDGTLIMHDLIQNFGQTFSAGSSQSKYVSYRSQTRLFGYEGIRCLSTAKVSEAVETINLELSNSEKVYIHAEAFAEMTNLRLLQIIDEGSKGCEQHLKGDFEYLSHELRCVIWHRCPLRSLPSNFHPKNLVELDMRYSRIEQLCEGTKLLRNLKFINLSHSPYLKMTPDLTEATNLQKLILEGCTSLCEVHPSIFYCKNLVSLSLKGCMKVDILPSSIHMESLKTLNLSGCSNLQNFPEISEVMMYLSELYLDETAIKELPSSIERLHGLKLLSMVDCRSLVSLPDSIQKIPQLTIHPSRREK